MPRIFVCCTNRECIVYAYVPVQFTPPYQKENHMQNVFKSATTTVISDEHFFFYLYEIYETKRDRFFSVQLIQCLVEAPIPTTVDKKNRLFSVDNKNQTKRLLQQYVYLIN